MRAESGHAPVVENEYLVGTHDRRHALRDDNSRELAAQVVEGLPQVGVGCEVERGRRVVEDDDLGMADEGTCYREPLPLTTREVLAARLDEGIETIGLLADEVGRLRPSERLPELVVTCVRITPAEVLADGSRDEGRLLGHRGDDGS